MGQIKPAEQVLLIVAAFSRTDEALDWTARQASAEWGPIALASDRFEFSETDYYQPTMGTGLHKQFLAFEQLVDPVRLSDVKLLTNQWEQDYADSRAKNKNSNVSRPLNLDPGYITLAKLVLASTKDHAHRIYLSGGIFAEITLSYRDRRWQHFKWTFPDYRRADYQAFFDRCRDFLKNRKRDDAATRKQPTVGNP